MMFRNRTTKRIALLLAAYLLVVWGAGMIAYRTGLAYATNNVGSPVQAHKSDIPNSLAASQDETETDSPCGPPCETLADNPKIRRQPGQNAAGPGPTPKELEADTPLSIAMALTGESFDLSGGIFSDSDGNRPIGIGSIPGFVLAGIPSGGGGFGPPSNPPGANPPSSPPVIGGGDGGSGGGAPPIGGGPPVIVNPPGGGSGGPPDVLETPLPGAFYLFGSALAGLAFAGRKTKG